MTTNQTINGVRRELLQRIASTCMFTMPEDCSKELRALLDAPLPCAHEWTDDGAHLLVCTACGAQEDHDPGWRAMATAPTDGTMVRLLVEFDEHSTEDEVQAATIGANNFDNDEEDVWRFAGWCWTHDHFTEGKGTPLGWLPMLDGKAAQPQGEPVAEVVANWSDWSMVSVRVAGRVRTYVETGKHEQTAPVAVADLTARLAAQIALLKDLHGPLLEAGLEYDDKFEALAEEVAELIKIEDIAAGEKVERESQPAPAIHIPRGPGEYDGLDNGVD
ncbi:hypothetical protein HX867_03920 [Pseudomonas gingeri]|uniref:hypothetical protein n=1 Tax=Pseudomonas gingeri TaxID=117681 RepID=UPI0015A45A99|nr:hypothetical protein [Pseudomonas gingeri]NVZ61220.1 hypothetical protein [Pseudomonas gingeri]